MSASTGTALNLGTAPEPLKLLDAGCGRHARPLDLPDNCYVVGIDISKDALAANANLDEKILGNLETYRLPANTFDVAVCWDVLEHLRQPRLALDNIAQSLKPGGKMIVGIPNVLSPKGLVTKFTPHRFHVFVYKTVFKFSKAGAPGYGPFPTYLRWCLRPSAIRAYAVDCGLAIDEMTRDRSPSMDVIFDRHPHTTGWLVRIWKRLFDGADPRESELRIVLRRM